MKKLLYTAIVLLLIPSCNDNKYYDQQIIKEFSKGDFRLPTEHSFLYMFVTVEGSKIGVLHLNQLYYIYKSFYKNSYSSFENFLFEALNQKLIFREEHMQKTNGIIAIISNIIKIEHDNKGIDYLLEKYFDKGNNKQYILKKNLLRDERYSLLYYFFLKNYKVTKDDYIGEFSIENSPM